MCVGLLTMWQSTAATIAASGDHSFKAKPSFLVSHELPLEDAVEAYKRFDEGDKGWTKVVLKPAAASRPAKGSKAASVAKG